MLAGPLTQWKCDVCGHGVTADRGIVTFERDEAGFAYGFRIIHKNLDGKRCDDKTQTSWYDLPRLLGADGLVILTAFLTAGEVHLSREEDRNTGMDMRVRDMDDFVDLLRRLQIPYYEEARMHFGDPEFWMDHDGFHTSALYQQEVLQRAAARPVGGPADD